ncbi:POK19 protein, partial [Ciccaba nigrolineata]|nr:POK19 protein [Ciccaba nigrolineata]
LTERNAWADAAVAATLAFQKAQASHDFFHQNVWNLQKTFDLTKSQALDIIQACPDCQQTRGTPPANAVNPRGLKANEIWQRDVTHILSFGRLWWVHLTVDTFSGMIHATPA